MAASPLCTVAGVQPSRPGTSRCHHRAPHALPFGDPPGRDDGSVGVFLLPGCWLQVCGDGNPRAPRRDLRGGSDGADQPWAAAVFPGTPGHPPACHLSRPKLWAWGQGPRLVPSPTLQGLCLFDGATGLRSQDLSSEGRMAAGRECPGSQTRARLRNKATGGRQRAQVLPRGTGVSGRPLSEPCLGPGRTSGVRVGVGVAINRLLLQKMDSFRERYLLRGPGTPLIFRPCSGRT